MYIKLITSMYGYIDYKLYISMAYKKYKTLYILYKFHNLDSEISKIDDKIPEFPDSGDRSPFGSF